LEQNQIDSLEKLKCLAGHNIRKINLEGNPVVEKNKEYRKELFDLIPSLTSIDGIGKEGENVESTFYGGEEEDGEFDGEIDDDEGEEIDDGGEDDEGDDEEDDEEGENKPNKKPKH
jgi:hypothetical protein